ncbi:UDP-N-acetylmuramoylalanine--D-glutamate ligase [Saezia sanguinis]|uniref:UDP-N-acetylmuramoylalanine--D-glutamate ligase n=1 Tax=Saezia sanguinis TaxID=1965230 RepID=A0A433SDN6_9BURK|nr:UDP-N-acetylmuramoyl-L-alanine--D-glutamate ligase [Saezia sanguinis]RUS66869.1 UDP-N-acetylmuramoylalanine--D-glutamate ligase [Saezia sanguinis]
MQYLQGQQLLILGLGISGLSMARWAVRCGAVIRVADTRETPPGLQDLRALVPDVEFISGPLDAARLLAAKEGQRITRVLRSPGLFPGQADVKALLQAAHEQDIEVMGELELFTEALAQIHQEQLRQQAEEMLQLASEPDVLAAGTETTTADVLAEGMTPAFDENLADGDHSGIVVELPDGEFEETSDDTEDEPVFVPVPPQPVGYVPKVIAVTGTNGKTTVTALTALLVERAGKSVMAAGNIGPAMLDMLAQQLDADALPEVWVLELSSFQLDGVKNFDPAAATILNLTQDHLDWHGSMQAYAAAKGHIFGAHTTRVLNRDDAMVMDFKPQAQVAEADSQTKRRGRSKSQPKDMAPRMVTFGLDVPVVAGDFGIADDGGFPWLVQAAAADETRMDAQAVAWQRLMPVDALRIRGRHNASNALAALALASSIGCEMAPMLFGLREYRGESHRVESVAIVNGVEYFDDSKGTNVGATVAALAGLGVDHRIVVILGGDGKGQDFSPLVPLVQQHVRTAVLIGRDAPVIEAALADTGVPMLHAGSMDEAVRLCAKEAVSGDVVLMSPACASLDMFKNYAERAKAFVNAVHELAEDQGQVMGGWQ